MTTSTSTALVTGGSAGLGLALVRELTRSGWRVVTDGRDRNRLQDSTGSLARVWPVAGDIADAGHRADLVEAVRSLGRLDLLVHNASSLGPLPLRRLADLGVEDLQRTWAVNVAGPHGLTRALTRQLLDSGGVLVSISSDAAVNAYEGWGAYGSSKAALDHLTLTFGAETGLRAYALDPGDMRTQLHADALPEDDQSALPPPEAVVPRLMALLSSGLPSGRYVAADLPAVAEVGA